MTVTARRVEESLQDTPISLAVFSELELEQLGVVEVSDIGRATAGLDLRKQIGGSQNVRMSIRGVGEGEQSLAIDPTVGVYVNGVYIARNTGLDFDIVDLQRIEVLRGPQGTLFGRNTIGGAINIITEKPRGELAFKQLVSYGARDRQRYHATLDTPRLFNGAAKLSFLQHQRGGLAKSMHTGKELGQFESTGFHLAVNWQPVDALSADYTFSLSRIDSQPNINQLTHVRPIFADPDGEFYGGAYYEKAAANASTRRQGTLPIRDEGLTLNSDIDSHALTLEWQALPELTVKSISSYRDWHGRFSPEWGTFGAPGDGSLCRSPNPGDYDFVTGTCLNPVPEGELVSMFESPFLDSEQQQKTQELQFIGAVFDNRLRYIAGLYYFEEQGKEVNPQRLVISAPFAAQGFAAVFGLPEESIVPQNRGNSLVIDLPHFRYKTDNQSYAIYSDITYTLLSRLDVTLGMRYTIDKKATTLVNSLDGQLQSATADGRWTNFNPALTVNYRWGEQLNTYAKVATGYRSGGFNVRSMSREAFQEPFNEENLVSYEIGWNSDVLDRTLRFNGAVFYMDYDDQQIPTLVATEEGAIVDTSNAGKARHAGVELTTIWLPFAGMRLTASYAYVDIEFKEFLTQRLDPVTAMPSNPGVLEDISDSAKGSGPEHSAALMAEYQLRPQRWGQWTFHLDANYTDEVNAAQLNLFPVSDSQALLNGRVTLSEIPAGGNGKLRVSLWGRNLTNKAFQESSVDFAVLGFIPHTYGELRSYGLEAIYEFNR